MGRIRSLERVGIRRVSFSILRDLEISAHGLLNAAPHGMMCFVTTGGPLRMRMNVYEGRRSSNERID